MRRKREEGRRGVVVGEKGEVDELSEVEVSAIDGADVAGWGGAIEDKDEAWTRDGMGGWRGFGGGR
jgi:hypothetical protein